MSLLNRDPNHDLAVIFPAERRNDERREVGVCAQIRTSLQRASLFEDCWLADRMAGHRL